MQRNQQPYGRVLVVSAFGRFSQAEFLGVVSASKKNRFGFLFKTIVDLMYLQLFKVNDKADIRWQVQHMSGVLSIVHNLWVSLGL